MEKNICVLMAYDYEDGSKHAITVMDLDDTNRSTNDKAYALQEFLREHYAAWLGQFSDDEDEKAEYLKEISEAATRLTNKNCAADCCGDCLSWRDVKMI